MNIPRILTALALLTTATFATEIELGAPFTDNAVLQRDMAVPVWGWGKPGAEFTVRFAGQEKKAKAGENGKWTVELAPLKASAEPAELVVQESEDGGQESGKKVILKNILVGEVWMASGQSNMQWIASKSSASVLVEQLKAKGETPPIREFEVKSVYAALHPIERAAGEWKMNDYGNYSAVAFAFALKIHQETGVPVGILNCSFSQTSIEAWVPREGFAGGTDEYTKSLHKMILETDPNTPEHKAAWEAFYAELENTIKTNAELVAAGKPAQNISAKPPGNLNGNRDSSWMFNGRLSPVIPYAIQGAIWNQGYANMGAGLQYYPNLHSLIRGWRMKWNRPELPVYFHQFYCPGNLSASADTFPSIGSTAEMRLGTFMARDIPHTGMASQIDIEGAIHYYQKALPGQRLALHALKNQYGKDVIADGPMFKSYSVNGSELTVEFDHAEGGLVVAETLTNASGKPTETSDGLATPKPIPDGAAQVKHFWLAGEDRVWHPASVKIDGTKAVVSSPAVKSPRGVSYGTGGIGFRPALYNKALLPLTPFIHFDNQPVTSETWPDDPMKIAGVTPDPNAGGLLQQYAKMPLLSTQFRDNAVLQADTPVTFWGSAVNNEWMAEVPGEKEIRFSFNGTEKTIPVTADMKEWQITVPAMPASAEPKTLKVIFTVGGEPAHEHIAENMIVGDVWYVAAPASLPKMEVTEKSANPVRMMLRKAKGSNADKPRRFSVATSTTPKNRFASLWEDADGFAAALGNRLAAKSGRPVGIILMQSSAEKGAPDASLKRWIAPEHLGLAPSLKTDFEELASIRPGNPFFDANVRRHIADWKALWSGYVPEMMATKRVPDGVPWGKYPTLGGSVKTKASDTYNVLVLSFTPAAIKGIVFIAGPDMVAEDEGALYGEQLAALVTSWKEKFGGDPAFFHTIPSKELALKITTPQGIKATAIEIKDWADVAPVLDAVAR
jgi:hypothetical protein